MIFKQGNDFKLKTYIVSAEVFYCNIKMIWKVSMKPHFYKTQPKPTSWFTLLQDLFPELLAFA